MPKTPAQRHPLALGTNNPRAGAAAAMPAQPFLFPQGKHSKRKRQKRQIRIFTKRGKNPAWKTRRLRARVHLQSSEEHPKSQNPKSRHPNTSQESEPGHRGCCGNGVKHLSRMGPVGTELGIPEQQQREGKWGLLVHRDLSGSGSLRVPTATELGDLGQLLLSWCSLAMRTAWELVFGTP